MFYEKPKVKLLQEQSFVVLTQLSGIDLTVDPGDPGEGSCFTISAPGIQDGEYHLSFEADWIIDDCDARGDNTPSMCGGHAEYDATVYFVDGQAPILCDEITAFCNDCNEGHWSDNLPGSTARLEYEWNIIAPDPADSIGGVGLNIDVDMVNDVVEQLLSEDEYCDEGECTD